MIFLMAKIVKFTIYDKAIFSQVTHNAIARKISGFVECLEFHFKASGSKKVYSFAKIAN